MSHTFDPVMTTTHFCVSVPRSIVAGELSDRDLKLTLTERWTNNPLLHKLLNYADANKNQLNKHIIMSAKISFQGLDASPYAWKPLQSPVKLLMLMSCSSLRANRCGISLKNDRLYFTVDHESEDYIFDSRALINHLVTRSDFNAFLLPFSTASYFITALSTEAALALMRNQSFDVTMHDGNGRSFFFIMFAQLCSPHPRRGLFTVLLQRPEINPNESILQMPWLFPNVNIEQFHHPVAVIANSMYTDYTTIRTLLDCPKTDLRSMWLSVVDQHSMKLDMRLLLQNSTIDVHNLYPITD